MTKYFAVFYLLLRVFHVCVGEFCEPLSAGYALVGHSFKESAVYSQMECIHKCTIHERCVSVNVRFWTSKSAMLCELNDQTRATSPRDVHKRRRSTYYEVLRGTFDEDAGKACSSGIFCSHSEECGVYLCRCLTTAPHQNALIQGSLLVGNSSRAREHSATQVEVSSGPQLSQTSFTGTVDSSSTAAASSATSPFFEASSFSAVAATSPSSSRVPATAQSPPDCTSALGMEDKAKVLESQITASSGVAKRGRLNNWKGWAPTNSDHREWLGVSFLNKINITAVATQGARDPMGFVQKYKVEYSQDCSVWTEYAGPGNKKVLEGNQDNQYRDDKNSIVKNQMDPPFIAKCVRIRPQNWSYRIGLRIELYGCTVNSNWSPFTHP